MDAGARFLLGFPFLLVHLENWLTVFYNALRAEFIPDNEHSVRDWAHNISLVNSAALPARRAVDSAHPNVPHRLTWLCQQRSAQLATNITEAIQSVHVPGKTNQARLDSLVSRLSSCISLLQEWQQLLTSEVSGPACLGRDNRDAALELTDISYVPSAEYLSGQVNRAELNFTTAVGKLSVFPYGYDNKFMSEKERDEREYEACVASRWLYLVVHYTFYYACIKWPKLYTPEWLKETVQHYEGTLETFRNEKVKASIEERYRWLEQLLDVVSDGRRPWEIRVSEVFERKLKEVATP